MANKKPQSSKNVNKNRQNTTKNAKKKTDEVKKKERKPINKKKLAIIIISVILSLSFIGGVVFGIWYSIYGTRFDYLNGDISRYITLSKSDYSGYEINVTVPEPTELDLNERILQTLAKYKSETPHNNGYYYIPPTPIANGWKVKIWYRGYSLGENGEKIDIDNTCNFADKATELVIGSGSFFSGFEISLIGKKISDYSKFTSMSVGEVRADDIVIVAMDAMHTDRPAQRYQNLQIDLSQSNVDELWGDGFRETLVGMEIGSTLEEPLILKMPNGLDALYENVTINSVIRPTMTYTSGTYSNGDIVKVQYTVTDEEGAESKKTVAFTLDETVIGGNFNGALRDILYALLGGGEVGAAKAVSEYNTSDGATYSNPTVISVEKCENNPITVEAYAPYDHEDETIRGKTILFDVYVVEAVVYEAPELTDSFVTDRLKLTEATLSDFDGETVAQKYRSMVWSTLLAEYEEAVSEQLDELVWMHLLGKIDFSTVSVPKGELRAIMNGYIEDFEAYCELYAGQYESIEYAAADYFQIGNGALWKDYVRSIATQDVVRNMIFYYIARQENLLPDGQTLSTLYEQKIDSVLVEYLEYKKCTPDKYDTEEAYRAAVAAYRQEIINMNGEQAIIQTVYYEYVMPEILDMVTVVKP